MAAHLAATPRAARGWSELAHLSSFFWSTLSRMFFRSTRARLSSPLHTKRKTSSISSFKISSVNSTRLEDQGPHSEGPCVTAQEEDGYHRAHNPPQNTQGSCGSDQQGLETSSGKRARKGVETASSEALGAVPRGTHNGHTLSKCLLV